MLRRSMLIALVAVATGARFASADIAPLPAVPGGQARLGVRLKPHTEGKRRGMLVTGVDRGGPATKLLRDGRFWSLEPGVDLILEINDLPVTDMDSYRRALAGGPKPILVVYDRRAGMVFHYQATLPHRLQGGGRLSAGVSEAAVAGSAGRQVLAGSFLAVSLAACGWLVRRRNP